MVEMGRFVPNASNMGTEESFFTNNTSVAMTGVVGNVKVDESCVAPGLSRQQRRFAIAKAKKQAEKEITDRAGLDITVDDPDQRDRAKICADLTEKFNAISSPKMEDPSGYTEILRTAPSEMRAIRELLRDLKEILSNNCLKPKKIQAQPAVLKKRILDAAVLPAEQRDEEHITFLKEQYADAIRWANHKKFGKRLLELQENVLAKQNLWDDATATAKERERDSYSLNRLKDILDRKGVCVDGDLNDVETTSYVVTGEAAAVLARPYILISFERTFEVVVERRGASPTNNKTLKITGTSNSLGKAIQFLASADFSKKSFVSLLGKSEQFLGTLRVAINSFQEETSTLVEIIEGKAYVYGNKTNVSECLQKITSKKIALEEKPVEQIVPVPDRDAYGALSTLCRSRIKSIEKETSTSIILEETNRSSKGPGNYIVRGRRDQVPRAIEKMTALQSELLSQELPLNSLAVERLYSKNGEASNQWSSMQSSFEVYVRKTADGVRLTGLPATFTEAVQEAQILIDIASVSPKRFNLKLEQVDLFTADVLSDIKGQSLANVSLKGRQLQLTGTPVQLDAATAIVEDLLDSQGYVQELPLQSDLTRRMIDPNRPRKFYNLSNKYSVKFRFSPNSTVSICGSPSAVAACKIEIEELDKRNTDLPMESIDLDQSKKEILAPRCRQIENQSGAFIDIGENVSVRGTDKAIALAVTSISELIYRDGVANRRAATNVRKLEETAVAIVPKTVNLKTPAEAGPDDFPSLEAARVDRGQKKSQRRRRRITKKVDEEVVATQVNEDVLRTETRMADDDPQKIAADESVTGLNKLSNPHPVGDQLDYIQKDADAENSAVVVQSFGEHGD